MRILLTLGTFALTYAGVYAHGPQAKDKAEPAIKVVAVKRTEPISYEKDVEPILSNKCQYCHSGSVQKGKLDMGTYESLIQGGKRGKPIVAGKSAESLLIKMAGKTEKPTMPPKGEEELTPEELALLKLWVDQGARPPGSKRAKAKVILGALPERVHPVRAVAISADKSLVAAGRANQIHLYDSTGKHVRSLVNPELATPDKKPSKNAHAAIVEALVFSPDGKTLASGSFQEVILWDPQTGTIRHRLTGFAERVMALAVSPNGKLLATGGGLPSEDGEIRIHDLASGKLQQEIKGAHSDTVFGVSFSPDGTKLATCGADKFVKVFEVPTGKFIKSFEGHTHHVMDVGWKADGKMLASAGADNVIKSWDYEKGEQVKTFANHTKQITRLMFKGTTSEVLACSGDQTVRLWNIDSGSGGMSFGGNKDYVYAVGISADGKLVAAGGEEGIVRLYNGANGQLIKELLPP